MDLDGRAIAERIRLREAPAVETLRRAGRRPRLVAVQVGANEAAEAYVKGQRRGAEAWGVAYEVRRLDAKATEAQVRDAVHRAGADPSVSGVLLQMPLPEGLPARSLQHEIPPHKDVEGVHPENLGGVVHGRPRLAPCTALAVMEMVAASGIGVKGCEAVVIGHSEIVGKPVALLLLAQDATVTVCHKFTKDVAAHARTADLLVVAVGKAGLVMPDMVKQGAVVVDVGINSVPDPKDPNGKPRIVGDVDYDGLVAKGCRVTPVPGGVGPVTVAMLLRNTVVAAGLSASANHDAETPPLFPDA
jgi:methylenetetrahydrofolate dehydrogenase (NADP+)/methenyltetrahydrofolate cyclohydrolase